MLFRYIEDGVTLFPHFSSSKPNLQNEQVLRDSLPNGAEPIAIVGMACRLPGGLNTPSQLWDLLVQGRSTQSDVPPSRFNASAFSNSDPQRADGAIPRGGYFLDEDLRQFDNEFFGINNLEAKYMDPEQRKLLEVVFECLESAGETLETISGAPVGCYVGNFTYDYLTIQNKDLDHLHRYSATGMSSSLLANRVSHVLNLAGPSLVLDTACSSSLYCLHLACNALRAGDCDSSVVAGVNLIQSPEQHIATAKAGVLSPTSACHTFDISADGYGRGENVGALYLKCLSKAIADGDCIRSVIRGTAVNSNGKTPGVTLPSGEGQQKVISKAYKQANLPLDQTDYVECHGTGTAVGDPIEVEALSRVLRRSDGNPLLVGSVKPSVGHSEAASAITSIIKATLALEHRTIPATFGVTTINPKIKLDEWGIRIATSNLNWPNDIKNVPRRISVNSFGFGGANAHVVLEAADIYVPRRETPSRSIEDCSSDRIILPFSARSVSSLEQRVSDLRSICNEDVNIDEISSILGNHRSRFDTRGFILTSQASLQNDLQKSNIERKTNLPVQSAQPIAFIFTGQGAQWPQMGLDLLRRYPTFRNMIENLDQVLRSVSDPPVWRLQDILHQSKEESQIHRSELSQPLCTAVQVALVHLLNSWGLKPNYVVGHSSGEIAAAFAAGAISADEAIIIAYYRGLACSRILTKGAMLAAGCGFDQATKFLEALDICQQVQVACINSPQSVTFSGDEEQISALAKYLDDAGVFNRKLRTDGKAYHSKHVAAVSREYELQLRSALPVADTKHLQQNVIQWISSVTGHLMDPKIDCSYWCTNLESPVQFMHSIQKLFEQTNADCIEIGPHPVLESPVRQIADKLKIKSENLSYFPSLCRAQSGTDCLLRLMGNLFLAGRQISWDAINHTSESEYTHRKRPKPSLVKKIPPYPWKHGPPLWNESATSAELRMRKYPEHEILGCRVPGIGDDVPMWKKLLKVVDVPWLKDHRIDEQVVFPAAGYIAMATEAACQLHDSERLDEFSCILENVTIAKALVLTEDHTDANAVVHTSLHPLSASDEEAGENVWQFSIASCVKQQTTRHAWGTVRMVRPQNWLQEAFKPPTDNFAPQQVEKYYKNLAAAGIQYGENFKLLEDVVVNNAQSSTELNARTVIKQGGESAGHPIYPIHPSTIDCVMHAGLMATAVGDVRNLRGMLPVSIGLIQMKLIGLVNPAQRFCTQSVAHKGTQDSMIADCFLYDADLRTILEAKNVGLVEPYQHSQPMQEQRNPFLRLHWKPDISSNWNDHCHSFQSYHQSFAKTHISADVKSSDTEVLAAVDLLTHKNPRLHILDLRQTETTDHMKDMLRISEVYQSCKRYERGNTSADGVFEIDLRRTQNEAEPSPEERQSSVPKHWDLIIFDEVVDVQIIGQIKPLLAPSAVFLGRFGESVQVALRDTGFALSDLSRTQSLPLIRAESKPQAQDDFETWMKDLRDQVKDREVVLVHRDDTNEFNPLLAERLHHHLGQDIRQIRFDGQMRESLKPGAIIVSTVEVGNPMFRELTESDLSLFQSMIDGTHLVVWMTAGGLLKGLQADSTIASGFSRALMIEQPALRFLTLDLDDTTKQLSQTVNNVLYVLAEGLKSQPSDYEFIQNDGSLHVSRFQPDKPLNGSFRQKQRLELPTISFRDAKPCTMLIQGAQNHREIAFQPAQGHDSTLEDTNIEIAVSSIHLDAYSANVLLGSVQIENGVPLLPCIGRVCKKGACVKGFGLGDQVVSLAPSPIASHVRLSEASCVPVADEQIKYLDSVMLSDCVAILHAVRNIAIPRSCETFLISLESKGATMFAVHLLRHLRKKFAVAYSSEEEKAVVTSEIDMASGCLIDVGNSIPVRLHPNETESEKFDCVITTLAKKSAKSTWDWCADFGCLVDFCDSPSILPSSLATQMPARGLTYTAFGSNMLHSLYGKTPEKWTALLKESVDVLNSICIPKTSRTTFDIGDVSKALQCLTSRSNVEKVTISCENDDAMIKTFPPKYETSLNSDKTYLMVGCLGGLGRSICRWMVTRGAKRFIFLSRSGARSPDASALVSELEAQGAKAKVVLGDVCKSSDVEKAVREIDTPLGGVIHGAMVLDEAIFANMSIQQWNNVLRPKVAGVLNLHNATKHCSESMDFFLITSSVSGSVGVATETNYCAANAFLDAFAYHRLKLGLPATSIGLGWVSEVGYLHDHPEIEERLVEKGVSYMDENDFLQVIDTSLASSMASRNVQELRYEGQGQVLTGLEPTGLQDLRKRGFEGIPATFTDPRASSINASFGNFGQGNDSIFDSSLPPEVTEVMGQGNELYDAVLSVIAKQFSNFLLTPVDGLDVSKPLAGFGIDSMLAAAIRSWFYRKFQTDVSFMSLLSQTSSIRTLAQTVTDDLAKQVNSGQQKP